MQFKIGNNIENISVYNVVKNIEEELDYGSLVIPFSTRSNRYQPFTLVNITLDDDSHEYWFIDSSKVKSVDRKERTKYRHEITLVELTKILERYTIPSRAFVQLSTGTQFTLLDVVENLIETVPFDDVYNVANTRIIDSIDADLQNALDKVSPDIFLTDRTLKEAFVEIFKVINAYPRLTTNEDGDWILTADYYNDLVINGIDEFVNKEYNIANKEEVQQSSKYATEFNVVGSNMIYSYDKEASSVIEPSPTGWLGMRSNSGLLIIDNSFVELNDGIEEIIRVDMQFVQSGTTYEYDITNFVLRDDIRKTLIADPLDADENSNSILDLYEGLYQANTIQFSAGSNKLEGFYELYNPDGLGNNKKPVLQLLARSVFYQNEGTTPTFIDEPNPADVKFRVQYVPKITSRNIVERTNLSEFDTHSSLIYGQGDANLASDKLLDNMFSRINRTGSTEVTTSVFDATEVYPLGSYTSDGYILTSSERVMYPDHYDVQYRWTKNYQKVSDFLGLNSEIKLFEIQSTLVRNEVFKQYVIIDTQSVENNSYLQDSAVSTFLNTIRPTPLSAYDNPIYSAVIQSDTMAVNAVLKPVVSYAGGNSLNFWFGFTSPFVAGKRIVKESDYVTRNEAVYYTDDNGYLTDFNVYYVNDLTVDSDDLPIVATPTEYLVDARGFRTNKGTSEILALTYQLTVTAQQGLDILVGEKFLKDNSLIAKHDTYDDLVVYVSDYKFRGNYINAPSSSYTLTFDANTSYLALDSVLSGYKYWAVGNTSRELYLAVNEENTQGVYFNFRNDRQDSTYAPPVLAPINLVTTAGSDAIFFDWDDAGQSDSFNVKIVDVDSGLTVANTNTTNTYYNFTDLDSDTEYTLSVRAKVGDSYSVFSSINDFTELGSPSAPSRIEATAINANTIDVEWEQVTGEEYYQVAWSTDGTNWYDTQTTGTNDTTYTYDNLSSNTTYYFRVRAGNSEYGDSEWFDNYPEDPTTTPAPVPTDTPTINFISQGEDYVWFYVVNNDASEADIYWDIDDSTPDYGTVTNVSSGGQTPNIYRGGLDTGSHTIYAKALASGETLSSYDSYGFTLVAQTAPDAPLNFQIQSVLLDEVFFQWTDNSTNETGFVIEIHTNSSFTSLYRTVNAPENAQTAATSSMASGTYYARIKAVNGIGDSAWTNASNDPFTI